MDTAYDDARAVGSGTGRMGQSTGQASSTRQSTTTAAQRNRLLGRLRRGPVTSIEATQGLDVLRAAARIRELRQMGHDIVTTMVPDTMPDGSEHRVARYHLMAEAQPDLFAAAEARGGTV